MIEKKRVLSLEYYKKAASFTGSDKNKNFKIEKYVPEESEEKLLRATVWPGPLCFDKTDDEFKQVNTAEFSDDGIGILVDWINSTKID